MMLWSESTGKQKARSDPGLFLHLRPVGDRRRQAPPHALMEVYTVRGALQPACPRFITGSSRMAYLSISDRVSLKLSANLLPHRSQAASIFFR